MLASSHTQTLRLLQPMCQVIRFMYKSNAFVRILSQSSMRSLNSDEWKLQELSVLRHFQFFSPLCFKDSVCFAIIFNLFNNISVYHQFIQHHRCRRCTHSAPPTGCVQMTLNRLFAVFLFVGCRDHHSSDATTFFTFTPSLCCKHRQTTIAFSTQSTDVLMHNNHLHNDFNY